MPGLFAVFDDHLVGTPVVVFGHDGSEMALGTLDSHRAL